MLYNTGTFVVSASASADLSTDSFGAMKSEVAAEIQGQNQPFYLDEAGKFILRILDELNLKHKFRFMRASGADQAFVDGTREYAIPSGTLGVGAVEVIQTATGDVFRQLEFVPWEQFNRLSYHQDGTGMPEYWTAKNSFSSQKIITYPEPDSTLGDYTLRVTSYQRIDQPVLDTDTITGPRELTLILKLGAEAEMLSRYHKENPTLGLKKRKDFEDRTEEFFASERDEPDLQWVLPAEDSRNDSSDPLRY